MFAAVGAQAELDKVRKDTGVSSPLNSEKFTSAQPDTSAHEPVSSVEASVNAVEDAAAAVVSFVMPTFEMFAVGESETRAPAAKA